MILTEASIINILPLEIIEDTIDIIAEDDRQTDPFALPNVKACSLTCNTFLPRSKQHIFRSIKIHDSHPYIPRFPPEKISLASSFATLLSSSPQIAKLVRDLHYIFPEIGGSLPNVPPILQSLTKLETFALYSDGGGTLQWWCLNPRSRSLFIRLIHQPIITRLQLGSITNFPPSLLFPCSNLLSVYLDGVTFDEDDVCAMSRISISRNTGIRLRELELRIGPSINDTISKIAKKVTDSGDPIFDLAGLKKLTAVIRCPDQIELTSKALKHARNVESIHLLVKPSYKLGPDDLAAMDRIISLLLPSLETLQYLHLDLHVDTPKQAPLAEIPRALKGIAAKAKHVKCLKIRISVNMSVEYIYDVLQKGEECHWGLLEEVLVAPGHWPSLQRFQIGIIAKVPTGYRNSGRGFSEFVQRRFVRLLTKGIGLDVDVEFPLSS